MKKILIIYPHFPPSNLAGVHRPRLFIQHLGGLGWEPVLLTVDYEFYEEALDWNLVKLIPSELRIVKVKAFGIGKPRIIGDLGIRAFFQLRNKALDLLINEKFDFVYIPIPSFYVALIGPYLNLKTGIKYGIDYIDPWVHRFPGSEKFFSRHWLSTKLSSFLEPIAVKKASLITGVAEGYYRGVIDRNPDLIRHCVFGAMPYGGEAKDHELIDSINLSSYLFNRNTKMKFVYAGAMLPKAYGLLDAFFDFIGKHQENFQQVEIYFIGTGRTTGDPNGHTIKDTAIKHAIWNRIIFEHPVRIPYLDVLSHLHSSTGAFILGSTEPHYTPSKLYQAVLSEKPVYAILHKQSSAYRIIMDSGVGVVEGFNDESDITAMKERFVESWSLFMKMADHFDYERIDKESFGQYSALNSTKMLVNLLDEALAK